MDNKKLNGLISFVSNSPGVPTGYGQQAKYLIDNMVGNGLSVAIMSNFGHNDKISDYQTSTKKIPHYPKGSSIYSIDEIPDNHNEFKNNNLGLKDALFILYDSWIYNDSAIKDFPIISYAPVDHITLPPLTARFLSKENVTPISMSLFGQKKLQEAGIASEYIPHSVDTEIYSPTYQIKGKEPKDFLKTNDSFLVGMVAANKSNGTVHRKAYAENFLGFSIFQKKYPNAKLYVHADPTKKMGGFDLKVLAKSCGLDEKSVFFSDLQDHTEGFKEKDMAGLYTAFDVLLATSYGEGFGVPTIEAQACGTIVVGSNWTATPDLVSDSSILIEGVPFWDEPQAAWWKIPHPEAIAKGLEVAYNKKRGVDLLSVDFAKSFDHKKVWNEKWYPFFKKYFNN